MEQIASRIDSAIDSALHFSIRDDRVTTLLPRLQPRKQNINKDAGRTKEVAVPCDSTAHNKLQDRLHNTHTQVGYRIYVWVG